MTGYEPMTSVWWPYVNTVRNQPAMTFAGEIRDGPPTPVGFNRR